jgi:FtsP/CotA-like multicopper oxidase with cupredoxin domain
MSDSPNRRTVLMAGGALLLSARSVWAASARKHVTLELVPRDVVVAGADAAISAARFHPDAPLRFTQGEAVELVVTNRLPIPAAVFVRGLIGTPALEPISGRPPIAPGAVETYTLDLAQAGTLLLDARLAGGRLPLPVLPLVVEERAPPSVSNDDVILIEDWRKMPDGPSLFTINGAATYELQASAGQRLRLRFINGAQRAVLAVKLSGLDMRVIALDGQPSEVFPARDGRLIMAPGTRADTIVDVPAGGPFPLELNNGERTIKIGQIVSTGTGQPNSTELNPLPSNGLPASLPLQSALRVDIPTDPGEPSASLPVAFRVKRGRTVVVAVSNPFETLAVFHLHGHPMRLLDRLDDGWKPFWLDTVAVPARQTIRLAFAATFPGTYLIETATTTWGSAKRLRSYVVE